MIILTLRVILILLISLMMIHSDYDPEYNKKEANSVSLNYILDQIIDLFAMKCVLFPSAALVHFSCHLPL
jgi:hypothetical protein